MITSIAKNFLIKQASHAANNPVLKRGFAVDVTTMNKELNKCKWYRFGVSTVIRDQDIRVKGWTSAVF